MRLQQAHNSRVLEHRLERFQVLLVSEGHFGQLQINCKLHALAFNGFGVFLVLTLKATSALRHHPCPQRVNDAGKDQEPFNQTKNLEIIYLAASSAANQPFQPWRNERPAGHSAGRWRQFTQPH
jgi:hypothetical protein